MEIENFDFTGYVRTRAVTLVEEASTKYKDEMHVFMKNILRLAEFYIGSPLGREYYNIRRVFLKEMNDSGFYTLHLEYENAPQGESKCAGVNNINLFQTETNISLVIDIDEHQLTHERYLQSCQSTLRLILDEEMDEIRYLSEEIFGDVELLEDAFDTKGWSTIHDIRELEHINDGFEDYVLEALEEIRRRGNIFTLFDIYKEAVEKNGTFESIKRVYESFERYTSINYLRVKEEDNVFKVQLHRESGFFELQQTAPCIVYWSSWGNDVLDVPFDIFRLEDSKPLAPQTYLKKINAKCHPTSPSISLRRILEELKYFREKEKIPSIGEFKFFPMF